MRNFLWKGRAYESLENCVIEFTQGGFTITSVVIGYSDGKIYEVGYRIEVNNKWETTFFEIINKHSRQTQLVRFEGDGKGNWKSGGEDVSRFAGCIDVDISSTPLTNSLPINRLQLRHHEQREIQVIYVDVLEQQIRPVRQRYTRLSENGYHYENVPNDFEADVLVDESGFVVDYPGLFQRIAASDMMDQA